MRSAARAASDPRQLARLGLLIALAGVLHLLETLAPTPFPWFRIGLGNAVVLVALHLWGWRQGVWVALGKVCIGALLTGRFLSPAFLLSTGGTLAAAGAMATAMRASPPLGFVGVSILGAEAHALAQLAIAAALLLQSGAVWALAPLLGSLAVAAGAVTGVVAWGIARAIEGEIAGQAPSG